MAASCPNCGTCTCTGSYLTTAINGAPVCSQCVNLYNAQHVVEVQPTPTIKTKQ